MKAVAGLGEKGDGSGEKRPLSDEALRDCSAEDGEAADQPKKPPSLDEAGDLGRGFCTSGLLSRAAGAGLVSRAPASAGERFRCGGVCFRTDGAAGVLLLGLLRLTGGWSSAAWIRSPLVVRSSCCDCAAVV